MDELTTAYARAAEDLPVLIAEQDADRDIDPATATAALRTELLARGHDVAYLSALAAHAIGRIAEARRWPTGRRYLTREVVEDIADDAAAKRREDV